MNATVLSKVQTLHGTELLRALHKFLPLGRKYHPLFSLFNGRRGLGGIPFAGAELVHPLKWSKAAAGLLLDGENCVPEVCLLPKLIEPIDEGILVDVGANIGIYPLLFRRHSSRPIVAYEPQPLLFHLLEACVRHNALKSVTCRNVACGNSIGEVPFSIGLNGEVATGSAIGKATRLSEVDFERAIHETYTGQKSVVVPLTTLDADLGSDRVSFLKVDCEGFEFQILSGAVHLLEKQCPTLFIEVHPLGLEKFGSSTKALIELLAPLYNLEGWDFNERRFDSKLQRSLLKHRPTQGRQFDSMNTFLAAASREPRPTQLYLIGRPRL